MKITVYSVHVTNKLKAVKKMDIEAPMFYISHGGHISYNEFPYGIDELVLEQHVDYAMKKCGLYYGVNIESSTCNHCGFQGEMETGECPECHSTDITTVNRCCGYLSYDRVKGKSRYNEAKKAEIKDRVDHV